MIFNIPQNWNLQDISEGSAPLQILRAMAQRHYAAEWVPRRGGFASFPVYRKPAFPVNAPYQWQILQGYQNVVFQAGTPMQAVDLWAQFQNTPIQWFGKFVEPKDGAHGYNGLDQMPVINSWGKVWNLAGIPGYRKVRETTSSGSPIVYGYGTISAGDIIGHWIVEDISKVYDLFTHRYFPSFFNAGGTNNADHELFDRQDCLSNAGIGQSGWEGESEVFGSQLADGYSCQQFTSTTNLFFERRMGKNLVEPRNPPDPNLPNDGQLGYWGAQYAFQKARARMQVFKAGQDINDNVYIREVLYHTLAKDAGAAVGGVAVFTPPIGGAVQDRFIKTMSHGSITGPALITPNPLYPTGDSVSTFNTSPGPESPIRNYVGAALRARDTNAIFVMQYEHST